MISCKINDDLFRLYHIFVFEEYVARIAIPYR